MIVGVVGLVIAVIAIVQTRNANSVAARALKMQEDQSLLRLVVEPRMLIVMGEGEDRRPRPVVRVINLSAFPVTVEKIWWKTGSADGKGFIWKSPPLSAPFNQLPARLEPRQAFTALGNAWTNDDDVLSVTAAVAITECGESIEGISDQWREYCDALRTKRSASN